MSYVQANLGFSLGSVPTSGVAFVLCIDVAAATPSLAHAKCATDEFFAQLLCDLTSHTSHFTLTHFTLGIINEDFVGKGQVSEVLAAHGIPHRDLVLSERLRRRKILWQNTMDLWVREGREVCVGWDRKKGEGGWGPPE